MLGTRASKYDKMFRAKYKSVFVKNMLSERLDGVHYEWKRGFNGQQMYIVIEDSRDTFDLDNESKKIIYDAEVERIGQDIADIIEVIEVLGNVKG